MSDFSQGHEWSKRQARTRSYPALSATKQTPTDWLTSKKLVAELRGASRKSWIHRKQDGGNGEDKEMAKTNIELQRIMTQLETDLEKRNLRIKC